MKKLTIYPENKIFRFARTSSNLNPEQEKLLTLEQELSNILRNNKISPVTNN